MSAFQWRPQIDPRHAAVGNQACRRIHLWWRLNFKVGRSARRLSRAARSEGGVFRGTSVPLNAFFWFVFCRVAENEHPRKNNKSKQTIFSAKKQTTPSRDGAQNDMLKIKVIQQTPHYTSFVQGRFCL